MAFGEKLKHLREERKMTQDDLSSALYVSRSAVSKWETNKGYPSIDTIVAIQNLFDVSIDYLIGEEDVKDSLFVRQRESRKLYWCAIGCFAMTVVCVALSLVVYNAGFIPWVLPIRVVSAIFLAGYLSFAFASKTKYQPKPKKNVAMGRLIASRVIILLVIIAVVVSYLSM